VCVDIDIHLQGGGAGGRVSTQKSIVPILELSLKLSTLKIHRDFNTHM